jgi:hypothetical protein
MELIEKIKILKYGGENNVERNVVMKYQFVFVVCAFAERHDVNRPQISNFISAALMK